MTVQDDLTRPWFQPVLPSESARTQHPHPSPDSGSDATGPLTTRIEGNLSFEDAAHPPTATSAPAPAAAPADGHAVDQVEVTQPYIPAIRNEQPEFAKRLNPDPRGDTPPPPPPAAPHSPAATTAPAAAPAVPVAEPTAETTIDTTPQHDGPTPEARPRKSWLRRAVRAIIGPDLLRKDPPKPAKRS
ncbi:hypothetical protein GCM10027174_06360 [Salinifilum aidingensis]